MKAFVINLDKDTKRLSQFHESFKDSSYDIERISGIYGENVSNDNLTSTCKYLCTNGMKGCSASHRFVWNKIINDKIKTAIIFEDDAYPMYDDYEKKVNQIVNEVPSNFDIINLTNNGGHTNLNMFLTLIFKMLGLYNNKHKLISKNICIPEFTTTTSAYIISNTGAKKLLRLLPKIVGHIDSSMYTQYKFLNVYAIRHNIFTQKFEDSNNFNNQLSFLIPKFEITNGFKLDQYLLTNNFQLFDKPVSTFSIILLILFLLVHSIISKDWRIFVYGSMIILFIYVSLLRITLVP
jgi:glycosyl transferase family 25